MFQIMEPELNLKVEENDFLLESAAAIQIMASDISLKVEENAVFLEPDLSFKVEEEFFLEAASEVQQTFTEVMVKEENIDDEQIAQETEFLSVKEEPYDDYSHISKGDDGNLFNDGELLTNCEKSDETLPAFEEDRSLESNDYGFLEQKDYHQTMNNVTSGKKKKHGPKPRHQEFFTCEICKKSFKKIDHLKLHKMFHSDDRPFSCDTCGKGFVTKSDLRRHNVVHTGQKPYACTMCTKSFTQLSNMQAHLRNRCQSKRFGCSRCNRMFVDQHSLNKHEANHGTIKYRKYKPRIRDSPPYFCDVCSMSFNGKSILVVHLRTHFGGDTITGVICQVCSKNCGNRDRLVVHMRSHTGEKPFSCKICGKAFSQKCNLKKHEVLHLPD